MFSERSQTIIQKSLSFVSIITTEVGVLNRFSLLKALQATLVLWSNNMNKQVYIPQSEK